MADGTYSRSGVEVADHARVTRLRQIFANLALARYLRRRCVKRETKLVERKADGLLFAASSPQNIDYAMRGLFSRDPRKVYHLARCRKWRGLLVVSRRVFWLPCSASDFTLNRSALRDEFNVAAFWLPPWPEAIECAKIDAVLREPISRAA
jgi:hypothetical protein